MKTKEAVAEWIGSKDAFRLFSLGRTSLARLVNEGRIRSASLAPDEPVVVNGKAKRKHGRRLYDANSIRAYLETLATSTH